MSAASSRAASLRSGALRADTGAAGALVAAAGLAACLVPIAIRLAARFDFFDSPTGYKTHRRPTPYLGGLATTFAFVAATAVAAPHGLKWVALAAAALGLWAVGTIDDRRPLSPRVRVLAEVVTACLLFRAGIGWHVFDVGVLDCALSCVWIVGVVNACNLMDNMD